MANKTQLQTNNTKLDSILNRLNSASNTVDSLPTAGADTADATATADKIFKDETAYADGKKLVGTFTIDDEISAQTNLISQIGTALDGKIADEDGAVNVFSTCNITLECGPIDEDTHFILTTIKDNTLKPVYYEFASENTTTQKTAVVENVLCNSAIIHISVQTWQNISTTGGVRRLFGNSLSIDGIDSGVSFGTIDCFAAPSAAGSVGSITVEPWED